LCAIVAALRISCTFWAFLGHSSAYADNLTDPDLAASMIVPVSEYVPDEVAGSLDSRELELDDSEFEVEGDVSEETGETLQSTSTNYLSTATFTKVEGGQHERDYSGKR